MIQNLDLGGVSVDLIRKDIKNVHLSVHPPTGRIRLAAPKHMPVETVRLFAVAKIGWIRRQQKRLQAQDRERPREYLDREGHFVWGRRVLLKLQQAEGRAAVELRHKTLIISTSDPANPSRQADLLARWYRNQIRAEAPEVIRRWSKRLGVELNGFSVRHMRTKWGSCSPRFRTIRLNTELAKKPRECLEYVILHEIAHVLDPTHGKRFIALMDRHMSQWRETRDLLNRLPVRHEEWPELVEAA
jgi:predicted metal-dependent hydrolase